MPKVTVIIPTFNRANVILRAVNSVLSQTFSDFVLIIIDDGSSDNTKDIISRIEDSRIIFHRFKKNFGACAARNYGIKSSTSMYIAFLDSDDEWLPTKLEKQLTLFANGVPNLGIVGSGRKVVFHEKGQLKANIKIPQRGLGNLRDKLLKGKAWPSTSFWPGGTPTLLIKKECFDKVGLFDEKLMAAQEHDLLIRLSDFYLFDAVSEPLVIIHNDVKGRISLTNINQYCGKSYFLQKHDKIIPRISYLRSNFNFVLAREEYLRDNLHACRTHLLKSVMAWPKDIKTMIIYLASLIPCFNTKALKSIWRKNY